MSGAFLRKLRSAFITRWVRPTTHEAGQALARAAAEKRKRIALTEQERRDGLHARLMAERAAGWPGVAR